MAYSPDQPLVVTYRLRNAMDREVVTTLNATLFSSFDAHRTSPQVTRSQPVTIPAHGQTLVKVDFGAVGQGHYHARLTATGNDFDALAEDQVAVVTLNGGRINRSPMWFGSMHSMGWMAHVENQFVLKHLVLPLGLDAYRTGMPDQDRGVLLNTDLLFAAGFGSMPAHLRMPKQKNDHRGEPNDYDAYFEWVKRQAHEKYLPHADRIISVEFYNEPDLPGFEFLPEIDIYLKMHEVFRRAFREVIPGVKIGTGGNTVQHGKEKKNFNARMYTELATEANVAIWHAHGSLENYITRHRMVENWVEVGGRPRNNAWLGNSEAGIPAGVSQIGRLHQADNLVKKIAWAQSQPNSLFYNWFTTTDTFDPQGGYLNNENWGLITYNQRLKPSGQAYNELIRLLANTKGLGEVDLDSRLRACAFRREDGTQIWAVWPRERGATMLMRFSASGPTKVTDMYGASRTVEPAQGVLNIEGNGYPFYLEAAADVTLGPAEAPQFASYQQVMGIPPGSVLQLPVTLTNLWDSDVSLTVSIQDGSGKALTSQAVSLAKAQEAQVSLSRPMPAEASYGTLGWGLRVRSEQPGVVDQVLPLTLVIAEKAVRGGSFTIDGQLDAVPGAVPIVLETAASVQDLAFDPNTPLWAGPDDLSVRATMAHDGKGLYLSFEVKDQTHKPGPASDKLWTGDSIQAAFYVGSAHTEIGLTEADGGFGWCWISPHATRVNRK